MLAQSAGKTDQPASDVHVIRVQKGYVCGWCAGAGYHTTITTIGPRYLVEELADAEDPRERPDREEKHTIKKR